MKVKSHINHTIGNLAWYDRVGNLSAHYLIQFVAYSFFQPLQQEEVMISFSNPRFHFAVLICVACVLLTSTVDAAVEVWGINEKVEGYRNLGRGSCQDSRGKMYTYLQRTVTFPDAVTCAQKECERFGNLEAYRGFEFSVGKRCTCLFDVDQAPVVPESDEQPYVGGSDGGNGDIYTTSSIPGTICFTNPGSRIEIKAAFTLFTSAAIFMVL